MSLCSFREWRHPSRNGKGKSTLATKRLPLEMPSRLFAGMEAVVQSIVDRVLQGVRTASGCSIPVP